MSTPIKIAILDDYQQVAMKMADWSAVQEQSEITVFTEHLAGGPALIERLRPFQVICMMRERTPLQRPVLSALPNLKLIVSTGRVNASLDKVACEELGVRVETTGYIESGAPELTWALLMALARNIVTENKNIRSGGWQTTVGADLKGKTIGIVGLGRVGSKIAAYAKAFDMKVIAWSENLTTEKAADAGVVLVSKESLFRWSDFVTVHLVLSSRSKGIIRAADLELMKPTACFINTSRGPLVDEDALIDVLRRRAIAGAAIDVFNTEPLPEDHIFRSLPNVLATPHIGYVTEDTYRLFYQDTVRAIEAWLAEYNIS
jgi:phosphoglycerate dehydrogenase-like enzyme